MGVSKFLEIQGARQNNLKNIAVRIPHRSLTVITGLSGSGKSSLAFDTLYAEGQRRYVESLSTYTRQFLEKMPKPDLDQILNIPPAIALEQKNHVVNSRSTVGTQTEILDYLRVLYARVGETFCVDCGGPVRKHDPQVIAEWAATHLTDKKMLLLAPLVRTGDAPPVKKKAGRTKGVKGAKGKSTAKSKAAGKAKPQAAAPTGATTLTSLFQVLVEQGVRRVYSAAAGMLDLEDVLTPGAPEPTGVAQDYWIVIDRLRWNATDSESRESRSRLRDSIEQALTTGHGQMAFLDLDSNELRTFENRFACTQCGREHKIPEPNLFSFNSPMGACPKCSGFGYTLDLDENLVVPDPTKTIKNGAIDPLSKPSLVDWQVDLWRFCERQGISIGKRYSELTPAQKKLIWEGTTEDKTFQGITACFEELKRWKYKLHIRVFVRRYQSQTLCRSCNGTRLQPDALAVKIGGLSLPQALDLAVTDAQTWINGLKFTAAQAKIAKDAFSQVQRRIDFLDEVGVGYLTLSRLAKSLSGGEFQRITLATQLGNGLCGTLYVLDEPSIGLHAADTAKLIRVLERLRDQGNTVVVVEHDLEVMRAANYLVELGPGAGRRGGELVAQGTAAELEDQEASVTGKYLSGKMSIERDRPARPVPRRWIRMTGCSENNLKSVKLDLPLDRMVTITGVSGSGKSTLVHKTLYNALAKIFERSHPAGGRYDQLYGAEQIAGVVLLDQSPIGRSSRSNPVTYLKAWDEVRRIYANQVLSVRRGLTPQHFSFNVDGGRCPVCKGDGEITLDMHFMAEVRLPCEECGGKRFKKNVLDIVYRGRNVHQLLETTIDEAYETFRDHPALARKLGLLRDVGLGYLQVGQSASTLSGGESQRLKIAATLDEQAGQNLLYIFDEPTTGLHLEDVRKLIGVMQDLVDSRQSVVLIEHHLDVIAASDWVIDLGPGGGERGGEIVAAGHPADVAAKTDKSATARMLVEAGYNWNRPERAERYPTDQ